MERGGRAAKLRSEQPARGEWLRAEEIQFCTETSPPHPQLGVPEEGGSHRSDLAEYYGRGGGDPKPEELSRQPWQLSGGILTLYYAWDHLKLGLVLV